MKDLWHALEERSRAWDALRRQGLADAIWEDYVSIRFGRTGDPRALEYLYPYLNHASGEVREHAIGVAARVFEGRGPKAVAGLGYFTENPDLFLRDRAVRVVGSAVKGSPDAVVLDTLAAYLNHRNQFIRKLALVALGEAAEGQASEKVLAEMRRVGEMPGPREDEVDMAIARAFAGRPTEEAYGLVAKPELADRIDTGNQDAVAVMVRGASEEWYERGCREVFEPRLRADTGSSKRRRWFTDFIQRDGIAALCYASPGRGMEALRRMLHLRGNRCTGHALVSSAPECFAGADLEVNRGPLMELARKGDVPEQRIAAACLGRLAMGLDDGASIEVLRKLCDAKNRAVQSAALTGLGMAARSSCDEQLRQLCTERSAVDETAAAAIRALGMVFLGSGQSGVFEDIRARAEVYRARPVRSKKHCKPLAACYRAAGLVYLGTGSEEPVEFLLDVLARPRGHRMDEYQWAAARALVMVEFSEARLGWPYISFS
jgi:HEAT repeat protein